MILIKLYHILVTVIYKYIRLIFKVVTVQCSYFSGPYCWAHQVG